jgi:hypothetical protein
VLIKELHPDVDVEHQCLELLNLEFSVGVEEIPSSVVNNKHDYQLVDGLANDHLPHSDGNNRSIAGFGLSLEEVGRGVIGSITKRGKDIHDQVDPKQLNDGENSVANKLGNDGDDTCGDVDSELELSFG